MSDGSKREAFRYLNIAIVALLAVVLLGQLAVLAYTRRGFLVALVVSVTGLVVGALIGFLFGLPRILRNNSAGDAKGPRVQSSSNLEDVADWFVKLLLGAGLAQINEIATHVMSVAKRVEGGFIVEQDGGILCAEFPCLLPGSSAVALAVVLTHPAVGFILGFLWTRLRLAPAFKAVETELSRTEELVAAVKYDSITAARELVRKNPDELEPDAQLAWALAAVNLAKQDNAPTEDVNRARQARAILEKALKEEPTLARSQFAQDAKTKVDDTDMLTPLYEKDGYKKLLEEYPPPKRSDLSGTRLGYLVAALGQKHADLVLGSPEERKTTAEEAVVLMKQAIAKDPSLASWFEFLLGQDAQAVDNDLATLAQEPVFKEWLASRTAPAGKQGPPTSSSSSASPSPSSPSST